MRAAGIWVGKNLMNWLEDLAHPDTDHTRPRELTPAHGRELEDR